MPLHQLKIVLLLTERLQDVFVWSSEKTGSGASEHSKKKNDEKMAITRPRPDGGVIKQYNCPAQACDKVSGDIPRFSRNC